ncbi:MAG: hypothetical protein AAB250_18700 [Bdellovibrionota bacterium]
MSRFDTRKLLGTFAIALSVLFGSQAFAKGGGGGHQFGFQLGLTSTSQEHMNTLISRANTRVGGISTSAMNSAYEFGGHYGYRFDGSVIALLFRPTFFYQKTDGSGTGGSFNYGVTGFTFFPILRIIPLENDWLKFFMQVGVGYGRANGSIEEATAKVEFEGDAFGSQAGLGAEFCYTANHCGTIEGNYRYLTMSRTTATSASGTFAADSLSQATAGQEVEMDATDLAMRMSGLQFLIGYTYNF